MFRLCAVSTQSLVNISPLKVLDPVVSKSEVTEGVGELLCSGPPNILGYPP